MYFLSLGLKGIHCCLLVPAQFTIPNVYFVFSKTGVESPSSNFILPSFTLRPNVLLGKVQYALEILQMSCCCESSSWGEEASRIQSAPEED